MLGEINKSYNAAKCNAAADRFIAEAAMDVEEVVPGSDDELDDLVDTDSVPDDVYAQVDKALDAIVGKEDYDDTEVEELIDEDDYDDEEDPEIDALISEAANKL